MATLHIIEGAVAGTSRGGSGTLPIHAFGATGIPHATVTTSGVTASHTFDGRETLISIVCDGAIHIKIGTGTVEATTSDLLIPANTFYSFALVYDAGVETIKLAAIDAA